MKRFQISGYLLAMTAFLLAAADCSAQNRESDKDGIMKGLSGKGRDKNKPYLTAGDRSYIVGNQGGDFPDLGSHVRGEMGGLWMAPIKLMDGFWVKLTDTESTSYTWLENAQEFINYPYGNKFRYAPVLDGIETERLQFCPQGKEGIVIKYTLKNMSGKSRKLNLDFVVKTDVSPVWFSKENNIIDAADTISWNTNQSVYIGRDTKNPWFTVWGSSVQASSNSLNVALPSEAIGLGRTAASSHLLEIKPNQSITAVFVITGSNKNAESALTSYKDISRNHEKLLSNKQAYYAAIIDRACIEIPDKNLQQAYNWGKINTEWLVSDLPGIGRFLGAGAIEYPWLFGCDNFYALQGVAASGDHALAKSTLRTIKNVSERANGNGRIIHEMSSNGFVGNKGNSQETAQFAIAVWKVFEWTGDEAFLKEMYPYIKQGINWLLTEKDKNNNMFPDGYGIMEVKGLNAELIDVAVYTQQALEVASKMAVIFNDPAAQKDYTKKAALLKNKVNSLFWDDAEGSYCDFYGTREQAIATTKGAIEQIQADINATKQVSHLAEKQDFYKGLLKHLETLPEGGPKEDGSPIKIG
jgi:glycogen debranching enzyme